MSPDTYAEPEGRAEPESWCYDAVMAEPARPLGPHTARLGFGGELTLPKELREQLGWRAGTVLFLLPAADGSSLQLVVRDADTMPQAAGADREAWLAALRAARGMWSDRDDLPEPDAPEERDREPPTEG